MVVIKSKNVGAKIKSLPEKPHGPRKSEGLGRELYESRRRKIKKVRSKVGYDR